jgi:hypothetical protein
MANAKNGGNGNGHAGAVVGGIAAAAAAAGAGYYFYWSKQAKQHRKVASKWAADLKDEVVAQAKRARELERDTVEAIVDKAAAAYRGVKSIDAAQLVQAVAELKENWEEIRREMSRAGKKSKALATGAARTVSYRAKKSAGTVKRAAKKVAGGAKRAMKGGRASKKA